MKACMGNGDTTPLILSLGINADEWSASCPSCFNPHLHGTGLRCPIVEGWVNQYDLDILNRKKKPVAPAGIRTLVCLPPRLVATMSMLSWLLMIYTGVY